MMHDPTDSIPYIPSASNSVTTRAERGAGNNTAQPPLTSGFGAVIEQERDLQSAIESSLGHLHGHRAGDIDRILRHQQSRLGANIALLEQRYEALPNPERFASWNERHHAADTALDAGDRDESQVLTDLIARHTGLQTALDSLIECAPDGQRGELILREVTRNHEEMAWMLTALLNEDATSAPIANDAGHLRPRSTKQAEERWDNEGGLAGPVR